MTVEYKGVKYDDRYGSPFDRGAADSYYHRAFMPHYYEGTGLNTTRITPKPGTPEYLAYQAGYDYNEEIGNKKDWGDGS